MDSWAFAKARSNLIFISFCCQHVTKNCSSLLTFQSRYREEKKILFLVSVIAEDNCMVLWDIFLLMPYTHYDLLTFCLFCIIFFFYFINIICNFIREYRAGYCVIINMLPNISGLAPQVLFPVHITVCCRPTITHWWYENQVILSCGWRSWTPKFQGHCNGKWCAIVQQLKSKSGIVLHHICLYATSQYSVIWFLT